MVRAQSPATRYFKDAAGMITELQDILKVDFQVIHRMIWQAKIL